MIKKMNTAFRLKMAVLESKIGDIETDTNAKIVDDRRRIDAFEGDLSKRAGYLEGVKKMLLDRISYGEGDLRAKVEKSIELYDVAMESIKNLAYNISGQQVDESMPDVSHVTDTLTYAPLDEDKEPRFAVEEVLGDRLKVAQANGESDVLKQVMDLHRGYMDSEKQLGDRIRAEFQDELKVLHSQVSPRGGAPSLQHESVSSRGEEKTFKVCSERDGRSISGWKTKTSRAA